MKQIYLVRLVKEAIHDLRVDRRLAMLSRRPLFWSRILGVGAMLLWACNFAQAQEAAENTRQTHSEQISPTSENQKPKSDGNVSALDTVTVTASASSPAQVAAQVLAEVPGGTNVIRSDDVTRSRVETAADLLADQPGVFAQAAGGNDAIKISIRGSGINRGTGFFRSGVLFTFDGLPVTGPSGTPFELFEPLGLEYTEVLRGGNAFDRGALALGGAINYVAETGYDASPFQARFEAGSFGYFKGQVSSGEVIGPFDYFVSATGSVRQGFQEHSESSTARLALNFGYKINPNLDTRFFFRFGYAYFQQPGTLTRAQIRSDPTQANSANLALNATRTQPGSEWIANKTTLKIDSQSSLELGVAYQNFPITIGGGTAPSVWTYGNISGQLKYRRMDDFFDRESDTMLALYSSTDIYGTVQRYAGLSGTNNYAVAGPKLLLNKGDLLTKNDFAGSSDNVLLATNDLELFPKLWLTTGIAGTYIRRKIDITYPVTYHYDKGHFNYEPRVGLRYNFNPDLQIYANLSRSVEPRNDWSGVNTPQTAPGWFVRDLKEQTAWTGEIGARFKAGIFKGSLDYYYSSVKNELLTVVVDQTSNLTAETNASPTIHQGFELQLYTVLWHEGDKPLWDENLNEPPHRILLRQSYTWSNFYYKNDPVFGHNKLPGIPEHYYQAELRYEHPSGFYVGFNVQAASSYAVDYANSFYTDSYVIFGATIGYAQPKKGWETYVDFRNLGDKHYAADVSPGFNDHGKDIARSDPGDGFGVFGGISYKF
jgi:iron complex outermembrane receptor protein